MEGLGFGGIYLGYKVWGIGLQSRIQGLACKAVISGMVPIWGFP